MLYTVHIYGSLVCKTLFCLLLEAQKCKIDCMIRYFQALLCFYTRIFQTRSNQGVESYYATVISSVKWLEKTHVS